MATWQFDVLFVLRGGPRPRLKDSGYDVESLPESMVSDARHYLIERLGKPQEMFPGYLVFGAEDGSRFDLGLVAQGSATLKARIDARTDASGFIRIACDLAKHLDCVLFVFESEAWVEPDVVALSRALANSNAAAFVRDPHGFLA